MHSVKRYSGNPIITPNLLHPWEAKATFNPGAIDLNGKIHILYRATSLDDTSSFGYASTEDGINITERLDYPVYVPREEFESKIKSNANSGCEDPRLTKIGDRIYLCYVAYDGVGPPFIAISSISESDFLAHNFNWEKPFMLTPRDLDDKDACLFPEKFAQGYLVLHRVGTTICGEYLASLDFKTSTVKKCIKIIGPREGKWDNYKVGIAAPPIKTAQGWLLFYHGIEKKGNTYTYRVSTLLLDLEDPTIVRARGEEPIMEPQEGYEKEGVITNVVFPCGVIERDGLLYIYYGGGDRVTGVATIETKLVLEDLLKKK